MALSTLAFFTVRRMMKSFHAPNTFSHVTYLHKPTHRTTSHIYMHKPTQRTMLHIYNNMHKPTHRTSTMSHILSACTNPHTEPHHICTCTNLHTEPHYISTSYMHKPTHRTHHISTCTNPQTEPYTDHITYLQTQTLTQNTSHIYMHKLMYYSLHAQITH